MSPKTVLSILFGIGLLTSESAYAATITINASDADGASSQLCPGSAGYATDGKCNLCEAIRAANNNLAVDGCAAGGFFDDTIVLQSGAAYTVSKKYPGPSDNAAATGDGNNCLPAVFSNITINGQGATIQRNPAGDKCRLFEVKGGRINDPETGTPGNLGLFNLAVTGGDLTGVAGSPKGGAVQTSAPTCSPGCTSGSVALTTATLTGNKADSGGAIHNNGTATLTQSQVTDNEATFHGGGIYNGPGKLLTIQNNSLIGNIVNTDTGAIIVAGNKATNDGGGLYNDRGTVTIQGSTMIGTSISVQDINGNTLNPGNQAEKGGGLYNHEGTVTLNIVHMRNNLASSSGGAIYNTDNATLTATGGYLINNQALTDAGGGIDNHGAMTISNIYLAGNRVGSMTVPAGVGGGIHVSSTSAPSIDPTVVTGSAFSWNTARDGAAIGNEGELTLINSAAGNNTASNNGGGIYNDDSGSATIRRSAFSNNSAWSGGGVATAGWLTLTNSTLNGNLAGENGGGLSIEGCCSAAQAPTTLNNVTIANNKADSNADGFGDGGGVYVNETNLVELRNSLMAGNIGPGGDPSDCFNQGPNPSTINSRDYNLIQNTTGCDVIGMTAHNLYGQNPQLGPLGYNGGSTQNQALLDGSPAIDAGDPAVCQEVDAKTGVISPLSTDQRGKTRNLDGDGNGTAICDIGAYELVRCGNTVVDPGEECDDGNSTAADGCSASCRLEVCGNGTVDPNEQCDDGNTAGGNGCSPSCLTEETTCPVVSDITTRINGSNILGSTTGGTNDHTGSCVDGAAPERVYTVTLPVSCPALAVSLDHSGTNYDTGLYVRTNCLDPGETSEVACNDDGNQDVAVVSSDVTFNASAGTLYYIIVAGYADSAGDFEMSLSCPGAAICGNSVTEGTEQCDDGNTADGDGCSGTCRTEAPAPAAAVCGNNVREGAEECDDGNSSNNDDCLNTCQIASCGDDFVRSAVEQCDDGNKNNNDGCDSSCHLEFQSGEEQVVSLPVTILDSLFVDCRLEILLTAEIECPPLPSCSLDNTDSGAGIAVDPDSCSGAGSAVFFTLSGLKPATAYTVTCSSPPLGATFTTDAAPATLCDSAGRTEEAKPTSPSQVDTTSTETSDHTDGTVIHVEEPPPEKPASAPIPAATPTSAGGCSRFVGVKERT